MERCWIDSYIDIILFIILFTIVIAGSAALDIPKLHQLDYLERNGKKVKLIDAVAAHWDKVALRLHFEGYDRDRIARDHHQQSVSAATTVFTEWLNGKGRQPPSWAVLIKALQETELFTDIINDLECILGISNDDLTESQEPLHVSSLCSKSHDTGIMTLISIHIFIIILYLQLYQRMIQKEKLH